MALEFALVGTALMMLVMGIAHVGFCLYVQVVLDRATVETASLFQSDKNKLIGDPTSSQVKSQSVCPQLHGLLDCASISVLNYPVSDYKTGSPSSVYNPGQSKSTMLLVLNYAVPIPTWPVLSGPSPMVITSSVPYVNEF